MSQLTEGLLLKAFLVFQLFLGRPGHATTVPDFESAEAGKGPGTALDCVLCIHSQLLSLTKIQLKIWYKLSRAFYNIYFEGYVH